MSWPPQIAEWQWRCCPVSIAAPWPLHFLGLSLLPRAPARIRSDVREVIGFTLEGDQSQVLSAGYTGQWLQQPSPQTGARKVCRAELRGTRRGGGTAGCRVPTACLTQIGAGWHSTPDPRHDQQSPWIQVMGTGMEHTWIYTHVYTHTCTHSYTHVHRATCMCIHTHTQSRMHTHAQECRLLGGTIPNRFPWGVPSRWAQ